MRLAAVFGWTSALLLETVELWAEKRGLAGKHLQERFFQYGDVKVRGLASPSDITAGSTVLSLPSELLFHPQGSGLEDDLGVKPALHGLLAAHRKLGGESEWAPYIRDLPDGQGGLDTFRSFHPLLASDDLLAKFSSMPLVHDLQSRRKEASQQFQAWRDAVVNRDDGSPLMAAAADVEEEEFLWGYMVCLTRCFNVHLMVDGSPKETQALAPWADDMNTAVQPSVWWASDTSSGNASLVFTALRDISADEELLIPYGPERPNDAFAAEWGFALPQNPNPVAAGANCSIHVEASPDDPPQVYATLAAVAKEYCPSK